MSKMKDLQIAEMNGDRLNEAALVREAMDLTNPTHLIELKPNAHSSHATLIAEIVELKRQRNEALDALGKEKAALNATLKAHSTYQSAVGVLAEELEEYLGNLHPVNRPTCLQEIFAKFRAIK